MIWDIKQPCKSCPYRKDSPLGLWHPNEFVNLLRQDGDLLGALFGCHEYNKRPPETHRPCAGWLLDQKKRNVPSIMLRLAQAKNPQAAACLKEVSGKGLRLFRTLRSMCRANGVGR